MKNKNGLSEKLLNSGNYRIFLRTYLDEMGPLKKINYSELSRRSGFTSRSFIKEVIDGKKALTAQSVGKIKKGLKLSGLLGNFFELLVAIEEPEANVGAISEEILLERLDKLRQRLRKQASRTGQAIPKEVKENIFLNRHVSEVYASLGTIENGASLTEIQSRCGLALNQIEPVLLHLLRFGVIAVLDARYHVKNPDLDILNLDENVNFQNTYLQGLVRLKERAEKGLKSPSELFLHTAFSVQEDRLPLLKHKLQKALIDFMDEEQDDMGNKVVKMSLGFYL